MENKNIDSVQETAEFNLYYEQMQHNYNAYLKNVWTTLTLVLAAIGAIFANVGDVKTVMSNCTIFGVSIGVVAIVWLIHSLAVAGMYKESKRLMDAIKKPKAVIEYYNVSGLFTTVSLLLNASAFTFLILVIKNI